MCCNQRRCCQWHCRCCCNVPETKQCDCNRPDGSGCVCAQNRDRCNREDCGCRSCGCGCGDRDDCGRDDRKGCGCGCDDRDDRKGCGCGGKQDGCGRPEGECCKLYDRPCCNPCCALFRCLFR